MIICTSNYDQIIEIGSRNIWHAVYSTIVYHLPNAEDEYSNLMPLFTIGKVNAENALIAAREMNLIRDQLAQVPPNEVVFDLNNVKKKFPWDDNISPVITSCMNYFTTADGKDLLFEITSILVHANYFNVDVKVDDK